MDDYLPTALLIVLAVNLIFFLGQAAIADLGTDIGTSNEFYNAQGSLLCQSDANHCAGTNYVLDSGNPTGDLPTGEVVEAGDGSLYTDTFSSIKGFFTTLGKGLSYMTQLLSGPYQFIKLLGMPDAFSWAVAGMWYLFTLFVIIAFFWGR